MSYCSIASLKEFYDSVRDLDWEDNKFQVYLDKADNYINSKLAGYYDVPFSTVPLLVIDIAKDLTYYFIMLTQFSSQGNIEKGWLGEIKKNVDEVLKEIVDGNQELLDSSGTLIARDESIQITSTMQDYDATFDMREPTQQKIDTDMPEFQNTENEA